MAHVDFIQGEGYTLAIADEAGECGDCGAMHFIFVNRGGGTRCVGCDQKIRRAQAEAAGPIDRWGVLRAAAGKN